MEIIKGNLYKSKDDVVFVLAEKKTDETHFAGIVVKNGFYPKGYYSKDFTIDLFEPYSAEIILKEVIDFSKVQFLEMHDGEIVLTSGQHDDDIFYCNYVSNCKYNTCYKNHAKRVVTPNFK
jgi:hypothetical protein